MPATTVHCARPQVFLVLKECLTVLRIHKAGNGTIYMVERVKNSILGAKPKKF